MAAQLHLALVMAIDAKLLVLDEPTLGLDLQFRKQFYDALLNDYYDGSRTIVMTTHQVDEMENILTDAAFLDRGRIVLRCATDELETRYCELTVKPENEAAARGFRPFHERNSLGRAVFLFAGADRRRLAALGEVRTPSLADLLLARGWGK